MTYLQREFPDDVMHIPRRIQGDVGQGKTIVPIVEAAKIRDTIGRTIEVPLVKRFDIPPECHGRQWRFVVIGRRNEGHRQNRAGKSDGERNAEETHGQTIPRIASGSHPGFVRTYQDGIKPDRRGANHHAPSLRHQRSICIPSSTTRPGGKPKYVVAGRAFREINENSVLRHFIIGAAPLVKSVSRPK